MKTKFFIAVSILFSLVTRAQQMDSIPFNGGSLFYHVYGKGKPVVILTGGPGISYQQLEEVAIEVGKRHQAILLEQRGTGRSMPTVLDKETVNLNTAVSDLNLLLDHLHLKDAAFTAIAMEVFWLYIMPVNILQG